MPKQVLFFQGLDSANGAGLWISNGTSAGTYELGGVNNARVAGAAATGLAPAHIAAFGSRILFSGRDSAGGLGLWISDGTVSGTREIGGLGNAGVTGAHPAGLAPQVVATFGAKAMFLGADAHGGQRLWVTDGTAAGTSEIGGLDNAGIAGASATSFNPGHFTAFGNRVLFSATDSAGYTGLWISDGTAAGTVELGGLNNAGIAGVDDTPGGAPPSDFAVLGAKAMFKWADATALGLGLGYRLWVTDGSASGTFEIGGLGAEGLAGAPFAASAEIVTLNGRFLAYDVPDASQKFGLWVSDGTLAGTVELGGLGSAGIGGLGDANGAFVRDMAVIGARALFAADDAGGASAALWVTDGTSGGTLEIGGSFNVGVAGANAGGLQVSQLTSLGSKALFQGVDAAGNAALWVTDGTLAGTFEIGGLANAGVASGGLAASDLTAAGALAYFHVPDAQGQQILWVSDGTLAGTRALSNIAGSSAAGLSDSALAAAAIASLAPDDFNGDGRSDILWTNTGGTVGLWSAGSGGVYVGLGGAGSDWGVAGAGDFDGDGKADILWRNSAGAVGLWSGGSGGAYAALGGAGPDWRIAGVDDFNGDGRADVLWRHSGGTVGMWSGGSGAAYSTLGGAGSDWGIAGVGDFNGDGKADILWRNSSGAAGYWSAGSAGAFVSLGGANSSWSIAGVGDFDGDSKADVLWRNTGGTVGYWASSAGGAFTALGGADSSWSLAGVADFNGDGLADVLWRNSGGTVGAWQSASGGAHPWVTLGGADASWRIAAA